MVEIIYGKYGEMILTNMEKNYPLRKKELEFTAELEIKILERENYILNLKKQIEEQKKKEYKSPETNEIFVMAKYQQMIDALVDEALMSEIIKKI